MPSPEIALKEMQSMVAQFQVDYRAMPYFLALMDRLMTEAPSLLTRTSTREAIVACTLVDRTEFSRSGRRPPKISRKETFLHWEVVHEFWARQRDHSLFMHRMNGDRTGLWPLLQTGLRSLEPDIPPLNSWDFSDPDFQRRLQRKNHTWVFLTTIAQLLKVLTKA